MLAAAGLGTVAVAGQKAGEVLAPAITEIQPPTYEDLAHALLCLVVAAVLGAILAFRPRRAGGPPRVAHVTQAQIMMAIVGALVMLIVGASLARAFAITGTAGLVRYRAKIDNPKDASVMLSCLAVGLASGVGLLYLAAAGTAFILSVLWLLEWREPWPPKFFELTVTAKDPASLKSAVEALLAKHRIKFELRGSTEKDMTYWAQVPQGRRTDRISEAIVALRGAESVAVEWDEKKAAK
jgi:uncharacterized membrane protein YhiD involved in acid resistance